MEEVRSAFKIVTNKPTGIRLLGRPKHRLENNIRMDLKEITRNWLFRLRIGHCKESPGEFMKIIT